jgi:hypothetical protein
MDRRSSMLFGKSGLMLRMGRTVACRGRVPPRDALITLEWLRIDETTVVGTITADSDFQIVLETYIPLAGTSWGRWN